MATFNDSTGREWSIRFDGLTLRALRDELKINLADVTGETYVKLESDDAELTAAVCFLLRNELATAGLKKEQLAERLVGESLESAMSAIWGAAKVFFRPKLWSALESNCGLRREAMEQWTALRPALLMLNQPDMPPAMKDAVMEMLAGMMQKMTPGDSPELMGAKLSALGQDASPLNFASDSPAISAKAPAA